eukprot:13991992-Heterocapsa_arctica.AAC.1
MASAWLPLGVRWTAALLCLVAGLIGRRLMLIVYLIVRCPVVSLSHSSWSINAAVGSDLDPG